MPDSSVEGTARSCIQAVGSHNMGVLENLISGIS